jgi:hypothetical protein
LQSGAIKPQTIIIEAGAVVLPPRELRRVAAARPGLL